MSLCKGSLWVLPPHTMKTFDLTETLLGVNGFCILAIAIGSLICNTLAVKVGKRPIYLITTVGLAVSSFWAAESTSFASLSVARALQGFCMGGFGAHHLFSTAF